MNYFGELKVGTFIFKVHREGYENPLCQYYGTNMQGGDIVSTFEGGLQHILRIQGVGPWKVLQWWNISTQLDYVVVIDFPDWSIFSETTSFL